MEPVAALLEIADLLEAALAPAYKAQAFRRAAATAAGLDGDRLAELATAGRLGDLPGIGPTTATVVAEALAGEVPAYLATLREEAAADRLPPAAGDLRSRLRGDCHAHSTWSDGGTGIREMALAARELGHDYLAMTDHSPRLTVAHGLDPGRLARQLDEIAALNEELAPFRILTGIEVDILEDGALDQEEDLLARLDVVVASAHAKLRMDAPAMTERLLRAVESPHTDILGHCTGRLLRGKGRPPSTFDADAVFEACAGTRTAVEVNCRPERQDPPAALLSLAAAKGCLLAVDTDAHAPGQLRWQGSGCARVAEAGVPADRVVNTWALDRFLAWTGDPGRAVAR